MSVLQKIQEGIIEKMFDGTNMLTFFLDLFTYIDRLTAITKSSPSAHCIVTSFECL